MNKIKVFIAIILFALFSCAIVAQSSIHLPCFFGDNMVVQRQKPIKIWGTSDSQKPFFIEFRGETQKVRPSLSGNWQAQFKPAEAGGPYEMTFIAERSFSLKNILIGDVWFCSGQSNMEMKVVASFNSGYELRDANIPEIRSFQVMNNLSSQPLSTILPTKWLVSSSDNAASFSAVAYYFAKKIHQDEKVPIGIINDSWGGTAIESWMSLESIGAHPDFKSKVDQLVSARHTDQSFDALLLKSKKANQEWRKKVESMDSGYIEKWYSSDYIPQKWDTLVAPGTWENQGLKDFHGIVWLRKAFYIPNSLSNKKLVVSLEILNNIDYTYFNGVQVGSVQWDNGRRIYTIPANLVKEGTNVIVIWLLNTRGSGGFQSKNPADLKIQEAVESDRPLIVPLSGAWQYKASLSLAQIPPLPVAGPNHSTPSSIYNAMVAPFGEFPLKGFLWYQGESNSWRAWQYRFLFPAMIKDWRKQFNQGDLPFLFVQLSGFGALKENPSESFWAELREAQVMALALPNTGMAVTFDIGNPYDVHPTNKQEVGRRLAVEAEKLVYGKLSIQTSPIYKSMRVVDNMIHLRFSNSDNGLVSKDSELKGFSIAGDDKVFVWAKARIIGDEVVVESNQILKPVAVRYAWTESPLESCGANLYNKDGFPASPFRTDDWAGETFGNR